VRRRDFVYSLGCTVYYFCVGVYVVSVPGYTVDNEGYLKATGVDFVVQFILENNIFNL
jgi:hypothetical protein